MLNLQFWPFLLFCLVTEPQKQMLKFDIERPQRMPSLVTSNFLHVHQKIDLHPRSVLSSYCTVINDWAKILNNGGQVDSFTLDLEKACDTPPHELLKSKLFCYGICYWIDRFFSVLQTIASCCKRSKIGLSPGFVWCPTGHCPWSLIVFFVH